MVEHRDGEELWQGLRGRWRQPYEHLSVEGGMDLAIMGDAKMGWWLEASWWVVKASGWRARSCRRRDECIKIWVKPIGGEKTSSEGQRLNQWEVVILWRSGHINRSDWWELRSFCLVVLTAVELEWHWFETEGGSFWSHVDDARGGDIYTCDLRGVNRCRSDIKKVMVRLWEFDKEKRVSGRRGGGAMRGLSSGATPKGWRNLRGGVLGWKKRDWVLGSGYEPD